MTWLAILLAGVLAGAGAAGGEWFRLRRRWYPDIATSYVTAVLCACSIVLTQALFLWLADETAALETYPSFWLSVVVAFVVGPVLHGITWNLLLLLSPIENHQIAWIKKIESVGKIEEDDFGEAAALFSTYRARIPQFKEHVRKMHEEVVHVIGDKIIRSGEVPFPADFPEELKDKIMREGSRFFKIDIYNRWLVGMMLKTAFSNEVIQRLGQLDYCLGTVDSPDDFLVMPDDPVSAAAIGAPKGGIVELGPGSPYAEFCLPITKKSCLIAQWSSLPGSIRLAPDKVKEINRRSCIMASRFVFSPVDSTVTRRLVENARGQNVGMKLKKIPIQGGAYFLNYTEPIRSGFKLVP